VVHAAREHREGLREKREPDPRRRRAAPVDRRRILERLPVENYVVGSWVFRAASYAALGRTDAAKVALADALNHYPDVTIESFTGRPVFSQAERQRLVELTRAAGFPACAKAKTLTRSPQLVRLAECHAK